MFPPIDIDQAEKMKIIAARINEGRDTYAGRLDAWHRLGNATGKFETLKAMFAAAKLAFRVGKFQLDFQGVPVDSYGTFRIDLEVPQGVTPTKTVELEDGSTAYLTFLANVGKGYEVIQQADMGELLDHLVGQIDGAHYETAGSLDFGRVVWAQVNPNFAIRVGEDVSDIYLSFITSHDGSRAAEIYETATRQVCKNTVRIGLLKKLLATLRVRHSKNASRRIADWKTEIDEIKSVALSMQDRLTWLASRKVTKESFTTIMARVFPPTKNDDGVEESSKRRENILGDILTLYEDNDGNTFPEQRGTAYALLNSVTNWTDHLRSSKGDRRAESAVLGTGNTLKRTALETILEESQKMPAMPQSVEVDWATIGLSVPGINRAN